MIGGLQKVGLVATFLCPELHVHLIHHSALAQAVKSQLVFYGMSLLSEGNSVRCLLCFSAWLTTR